MIKPLITTTVQIFKSRFTVVYPEEEERLPDNYRGKIRLDMKTCISCGACARICPNQTIDMVDTYTDKGIKKMPLVNFERCLFCAMCEEVCPTNCLVLTKNLEDVEVYDRRDLIKRPEELE
ncbi:MAG: 4Fe-4S binding protein [Candidatus Micrarchaeia archaeon]